MKKIKLAFFLLVIFLSGSFFYFRYQVHHSTGARKELTRFKIEKGEGNVAVAKKLAESRLISREIYFYYYARTQKLSDKILPGEYELSGKMTIPEIVLTITTEKKDFITLTFPEGLRSDEIARKLTEKGLDGEGFLRLVANPGGLIGEYDFLSAEKVENLEGYLFPDTYFYSKKETAESIVRKFLDNFSKKLNADLRQEISAQKKTVFEILTMASIIEREVSINYRLNQDDEDAKIVAGIFWNRIKNQQALQSCATLAFVFKEPKPKLQYSYEDTRVASPYNTYLNKGLTPGPISNPGILAIRAALFPTKTDYNYFLNNQEGDLIFSRTIEEHNANKRKAGL